MRVIEVVLLALALSMDAFAAAICVGVAMKKTTIKKAAIVGVYFGGFQAAMPLAGFLLARTFAGMIASYTHWVAFGLLCFIGGGMIIESFKKDKDKPIAGQTNCETKDISLGLKKMLPLAIATSIDALAAGGSFALLDVNIVPAVILIGMVTFIMSVVGVKIGGAAGIRFKSKAEFAGGAVLILIGVNILLENLGVVPW